MRLTNIHKQVLIALITHIGVLVYAQGSEDEEGIVLYGITSKIILQNVNKSFSATNNTSLIRGETYSVNIKEYSAISSSKQFTIYIDYNKNGNIYERGENVLSVLSSKSSSAKFIVPQNITTGTFKLRVVSVNSGTGKKIAIPQNIPKSGQVIEEYRINITNGTLAKSINRLTDTTEKLFVTTIYPNPTKEFIHINTKEQEPIAYKLFNASGQMVLSSTTNDKSVNVKALPVGTYILKLTQGESNTVHKLIKQ